MPASNATPYRFVELDWNPGGHEPAGVYDTPHFDFHFYTVDAAVRDAIDPKALGQQAFLAKSAALPPEAERPTFVALAPPGAPVAAVPRMGVHWIDPRTPELQGLFGRPEAFRPFTTTFIHGSWDGRFIFDEPMITRAFILARRRRPRRRSATADPAADRASVSCRPATIRRRTASCTTPRRGSIASRSRSSRSGAEAGGNVRSIGESSTDYADRNSDEEVRLTPCPSSLFLSA